MSASTLGLSALDVGKALNRLVKTAGEEGIDTQETERLVSALALSRCETAADLLAMAAHSNGIVAHAAAVLQSGDDYDPKGIWQLLAWSLLLNARVLATLEDETGMPASGFLGTGPTVN